MTKMTDILLGIVTTAAFGLASFALKWQFDANAELRVIKEQIAQIQTDKTTDERQDKEMEKLAKTQSKFWKLHGWERTQISELRVKTGLPLGNWPDLEN